MSGYRRKTWQKKEEGLKAAIFTFDIPPKKNVEHIEAKVLTTNEEKMHIFEGIGIDYLIECPFTREVMCMEPFPIRALPHILCFYQ
jgi:riboflavin kinase / FMN adenylyltransferase